jgi:hypothetical protein
MNKNKNNSDKKGPVGGFERMSIEIFLDCKI